MFRLSLYLFFFWLSSGLILFASEEVNTEVEAPSREALAFFENDVRPLLAQRCLQCHGGEKQSGNLRLDGIGTILGGGDSGPAIVPGDADASLLVEAIRYESYEMPPDGKLSDQEIDILVRWVEMGAPWPGADRVAVQRSPESSISEEDRQFWSFQPLADPSVPEVNGIEWCRNDIDRFILARLESAGIPPTSEADRVTLIRRLSYTLTGLPPSPDEVAEFLNAPDPYAWEQLINRLLDSPRYGEHQAHYWLDLVRYAESDGFRQDAYRPNAWRYRDYVVQSFNEDKPYDQFLREQLAGDELSPDDPEARVATAYFRHGIYEYNQRDARTQWRDILNDITDTTSDVILGLGMGCARCHDHKFDPILQRDYYRLQAFFSNLMFRDDVPLLTPEQLLEHQRQQLAWEAATADIRRQLDELEAPKLAALEHEAVIKFPEEIQAIWTTPSHERTPLEQQIAHLVFLQVAEEHAKLASRFKDEEKAAWDALRAQLAEFDSLRPAPLPLAPTVTDVATVASPLYIPDRERLGEVVPGFLTIFDPSPAEILPPEGTLDSTGRRSTLARWLTRPEHPLTSRVIVNRIWQQHFGVGLVATPNDFGHLGEPPSHPELLDWLAVRFVEHGWSLKWLHREILRSSTWRQSAQSGASVDAESIDAANRLLWRQNVRRLDAEQIRDGMLAVAGELQIEAGGPSAGASASRRRSIYTRVERNSPDPLLGAFDLPARITSIGRRNVTTTPSQSLLMINGPWSMSRAEAFAGRLLQEVPGSDESLIKRAWQLAYGRTPTDEEVRSAADFLQMGRDRALRNQPMPQMSEMPYIASSALYVSPTETAEPAVWDPRDWVGSATQEGLTQWTFEAVVYLRSLYPDTTVRTIAACWDGNNQHSGWSIGITSTQSRFTPQNLILQLVGMTDEGTLHYEVIPSGILLDLDRPYAIAVCIDLEDSSEQGITFYVQDLTQRELVQSATVPHRVVSGAWGNRQLVLGGRDGHESHRWDGWIDDVRLSASRLKLDQLLTIAPPDEADRAQVSENAWPMVKWTFDAPDAEPPLGIAATWETLDSALVDLCHVLLNSNEFLYVD